MNVYLKPYRKGPYIMYIQVAHVGSALRYAQPRSQSSREVGKPGIRQSLPKGKSRQRDEVLAVEFPLPRLTREQVIAGVERFQSS